MPQFRAEANKTYTNPTTGQVATYTADQLNDPAIGWMSEQWRSKPVIEGSTSPVAPVNTTQNTQAPYTITSDLAASRIQTDNERIAAIQEESKTMSQQLQDLLSSELAGVEADYARREEQARESFGEQEATQGVQQFRLGVKDTPYGATERKKFAQKKLDYFNALDAEKQSKLSQLRMAYASKDYEQAAAIRKEIFDIQQKQTDFLQKERQNQLNEWSTMQAEDRANQEQALKMAESYAPQLYESLTGDEATDIATIRDYAQQVGVDPNLLMSKLVTYRSDRQKEDLFNSTSIANLLSKTKEGGTVSIPGLGDVTIIGEREQAPTTLTANGKIYNWYNGAWRDTGLQNDQLNESSVLSALQSIGDSGLIKQYLRSVGVDVPVAGTIESFKQAITTQESGNYSAINKDSGALGAYQIMPFHLSKIGLDGNKQEDRQKFLSSPELQDKLYDQIINNLLTSNGGDYARAAAAYYGGGLGAKNYGTPAGDIQGKYDKNGNPTGYPSVNEYVRSVLNRMETTTSPTGTPEDDWNRQSDIAVALSVLPTRLRDSDADRELMTANIIKGLDQGLSALEIADILMGYKVNNPDGFSSSIRGYMSQTDKIEAGQPAEFARMINAGNKTGVITKLERLILKDTEGKDKESLAIYTKGYGDTLTKAISDNLNKLGIVAGNWNKQKKKFLKSDEFQKLDSSMNALVSEWRNKMIGANATENELKMLESLIPSVKDNPFNAITKIRELQNMNLASANSIRKSYNLPTLNFDSLMNLDNRVSLYSEEIRVRRKSDGQIGFIPAGEFNTEEYEKIQ